MTSDSDESGKGMSILSFHQANKIIICIDPDGRIFWKDREVTSDDDFRAAMMDLHRYFCGGM